jgi:diguanylate cyclase (GGDEF)-like protein
MQVLIADDSPVSRRVLGAKLVQWGYETIIVDTGDAAWAILSSPNSPRLAIIDWRMPGVDGPEICRRLRVRESLRYTFVLLMTSCTLPNSVVEGLKAGADDFVRKPFDPAELEQRLRTGRRIVELQDRLLAAQESLRMQATHDSLTGLWNRAEILRMLDREWDRMRRQRSAIGALMIDVDFFKQVNDEHGHQAGDDVLREMGRLLPQTVRSYDQVGRIGGEEFLVVLPNATIRNVLAIGERARYRTEQHPIPMADGSIQMTVSVGAASSSEMIDSPKDLIQRADQALYAAKRAGRNRVASFADVIAGADDAVPAPHVQPASF